MDTQWALFLVGFKCILSISRRRKVEWVVATLQVISWTLLGPSTKCVLWGIGEESRDRTFRLILSLWNLLSAAGLHSSYLKVTGGFFYFIFFDIQVKIPCLKCLKAETTSRARESRKKAMGFNFLVFIFNLFPYMNEILLTLPRSSLKSKCLWKC